MVALDLRILGILTAALIFESRELQGSFVFDQAAHRTWAADVVLQEVPG